MNQLKPAPQVNEKFFERSIVARVGDNFTFDQVELDCGHYDFLPAWDRSTRIPCRLCRADWIKRLVGEE
jgi:hypothetical protein